MGECTSAFDWSVVLPSKDARRTSLGSRKPLATVVLSSGDDEVEQRVVALSVGKVLSSKRESGEVSPGSRAELLRLVEVLEESSCRARVENLLNRRDYSEKELRDRLLSDGYPRPVVDGAMRRFVESGLVSDSRYGELFVRSKVNAGWGQRKIEMELSRRGISAADIPGWPYEYFDPDEEYERALGIASARRFAGKDPYAKVVRFLAGRGFPLSVAHDVASRLTRDET